MKVLITGAGGQVGRALVALAPAGVETRACGRSMLDLAAASEIALVVERERPDLVINAGAHTAVDRAESEPQLAQQINAEAPHALALACRDLGARVLQVSTDFVFDGSRPRAWLPDDSPNPLSTYGRTKLAGEQAVLEVLGSRAAVLRTSWVYAAEGRNFVRTMLTLMGSRPEVRVVADQIGSPTAARSVAEGLWALAMRPQLAGRFHWTDAGVASWYDFAVAIGEEAVAMGLLPRLPDIVPITTAEYPTPAVRPAFSVLDRRSTEAALQIRPQHWRQALRRVLGEIAVA